MTRLPVERLARYFGIVLAMVLVMACFNARCVAADTPAPAAGTPKLQTATFGMGCFWCAQALFEKFNGITHIDCGYAGGHTVNPTYEDVCTDQTGHAEVVQITYDPAKISYQQLLDIFWDVHDPTTLNQQEMTRGRNTGRSFFMRLRNRRNWRKRPRRMRRRGSRSR